MIALWVKVRVKPEGRERFLKAIEVDALGSEKDEPGCYRFNVLQDQEDQNVYYFYEVYRDEAALEEHRKAPKHPLSALQGGRGEGPIAQAMGGVRWVSADALSCFTTDQVRCRLPSARKEPSC